MLEIGFVVNPIAGIGGQVGLHGSDGDALQARAQSAGAVARAPDRAGRAVARLSPDVLAGARWITWAGSMGEAHLRRAAIAHRVVGYAETPSSGADTRAAVRAFAQAAVDLILFTGGDGTARDVLEGLRGTEYAGAVLGIPAGVKMHSGVFATTPETAADVVTRLIRGGIVSATAREVRDRVEDSVSSLKTRTFGELPVPELGGYLQHTKVSGKESEPLALNDIAAFVSEAALASRDTWIFGPGTTVAEISASLGYNGSLHGFDIWQHGEPIAFDVNADALTELDGPCRLVVSFTRHQGFLFGRGNQQLTPAFLRRIGRRRVQVVGTRTKLQTLDGRPLLLDTDDADLDTRWTGLWRVLTGYDDYLWYRVSTGA